MGALEGKGGGGTMDKGLKMDQPIARERTKKTKM